MSQSFNAFLAGCNIVAFQKDNNAYGMCCAWAQMVDWDKITVLLGAQSVTGQVLQVGDYVGVSALAKGQTAVALQLGEGHSNEVNKFIGIAHHIRQGAITIDGAKVQMVCQVISDLPIPECPNDHFLLLKVLSHQVDTHLSFLSIEDVF